MQITNAAYPTIPRGAYFAAAYSISPPAIWHAHQPTNTASSISKPAPIAEVFGVMSGALSIAALFNNAVECFEDVQLGRHFAADFQSCQLRLDTARLRLSP